jgi:hypothetical protein
MAKGRTSLKTQRCERLFTTERSSSGFVSVVAFECEQAGRVLDNRARALQVSCYS